MALPRILFVDDEPSILEGLKLAFRRQRGEWDIEYACGGAQALALMEQARADVVISDMRMPGMDGAELLTQVKVRWPSTARLVLSGHAERESVLGAMSVAHQFLSKPLQADILKAVVARAIKMQAILNRPQLVGLAARLGDLPILPETYNELILVSQDPKYSIREIAGVVERDPLVSARILQLVNSAFFGLDREVASVFAAVRLLGPQVLLGLAMSATLAQKAVAETWMPALFEELQERALRSSAWARRLLPTGKYKDEVATAALIHDLGAVLLAMADPDRYLGIREAASQRPLEAHHIEEGVFGVTHAEIGAHLFGLWGLPMSIVEAIACHHNAELIGNGTTHSLRRSTSRTCWPPANVPAGIPWPWWTSTCCDGAALNPCSGSLPWSCSRGPGHEIRRGSRVRRRNRRNRPGRGLFRPAGRRVGSPAQPCRAAPGLWHRINPRLQVSVGKRPHG
jgi:HD-like signal output (HDOD) protein